MQPHADLCRLHQVVLRWDSSTSAAPGRSMLLAGTCQEPLVYSVAICLAYQSVFCKLEMLWIHGRAPQFACCSMTNWCMIDPVRIPFHCWRPKPCCRYVHLANAYSACVAFCTWPKFYLKLLFSDADWPDDGRWLRQP